MEEVEEFNISNDAEELADIFEILFAITSQMGIDPLLLDDLRGDYIRKWPPLTSLWHFALFKV